MLSMLLIIKYLYLMLGAKNFNNLIFFNMKPQKNFFLADKANCSFHWQIHLKDTEKVPLIVGYSKFIGYNEARDKNVCLCSKIEMLYRNGYFHKAQKIVIYQRKAPLPNIYIDDIILTWENSCLKYMNNLDLYILKFLENFEAAIKNKKAPPIKLREKIANYNKK